MSDEHNLDLEEAAARRLGLDLANDDTAFFDDDEDVEEYVADDNESEIDYGEETIDMTDATAFFPNTKEFRELKGQPSVEEIQNDPRRAFPRTQFGPSRNELDAHYVRLERQRQRAEGRGPEAAFPNTPSLHCAEQDEAEEAAFAARYGGDSA
jgi:hypothetical protein